MTSTVQLTSARPQYSARPIGGGEAGARASQRGAAEPVTASEPLKDPTSKESRELQAMKQRDREVRQHEQAHIAAAGGHASGAASFSYRRGPDGRQYAVGGEVQIDSAEVPGDPEATIRKMQAVQRAAAAPAEPSAQDRSVAASAAQSEMQARAELFNQRNDVEPDTDGSPETSENESATSRRAIDSYQGAAAMQNTASNGPSLDLRV